MSSHLLGKVAPGLELGREGRVLGSEQGPGAYARPGNERQAPGVVVPPAPAPAFQVHLFLQLAAVFFAEPGHLAVAEQWVTYS